LGEDNRRLAQPSKTKIVTSGNGVNWTYSLLALSFLMISYGHAWAGSFRHRLELVGYAREEITEIMSGRKTRGQFDLELGLKMQGYDKEQIGHILSACQMGPRGHGLHGDRQQSPDTARKKRFLVGDEVPFFPFIKKAATTNDVDINLVLAIIKVESAFDHRAVSPKGAKGLMQLMPHTAEDMGVTDPFDPRQNVYGGTRYLSNCMKTFNNIELALAAYNAGPTLVTRLNRVPGIRETQNFVRDVLNYKKVYDRFIRKN